MIVEQGDNKAKFADGKWTSENASFALWLNQVAPTYDDALKYGCYRLGESPKPVVVEAEVSEESEAE